MINPWIDPIDHTINAAFLLLLMLSPAIMHGQCEVTAYSYPDTIYAGDKVTTNTQIRWVQLNPLNANSESWGLDEIEIYYSPGNISVSWSTGDTLFR